MCEEGGTGCEEGGPADMLAPGRGWVWDVASDYLGDAHAI